MEEEKEDNKVKDGLLKRFGLEKRVCKKAVKEYKQDLKKLDAAGANAGRIESHATKW